MDSGCPSRTRSFSNVEQEEKEKSIQTNLADGNQKNLINDDNKYPSVSTINITENNPLNLEKSSISNPYSHNLSAKQVVIKRGRPRKYWPEYSNPRQNIFHQTPYNLKHSRKQEQDGEIPSLPLATQPLNSQPQDLGEKPFILRNDGSRLTTTGADRHATPRHLETKDDPCITKHASRRVDLPPSEHRHTLCYPTQPQISSAFSPARGQCYRSCCHSSNTLLSNNIQKYSEPYYLSCYPIMIQEPEQVTSPRLEHDTCYHDSQPNYSLTNQREMKGQSSPKNPIIIDCFSLATKGNDERIPLLVGINQESRARYQYKEEENSDPPPRPELIKRNQNKFHHNCMICQQIATGEMPQICYTSVLEKCNKCCYPTTQANSHSTASSIRNADDESCESYWDTQVQNTRDGEDVYRNVSPDQTKPTNSPGHVVFKQGYEYDKNQGSESQDAIDAILVAEDERTVINSAFSNPIVQKPNIDIYEPNLQAINRQGDPVNAEDKLVIWDKEESLPNSPDDLCYRSRFTSTNTAPLYSPDDLTASDRRKDLKRKWEEMYEILQGPDKSNKKSYSCTHCGRAFTHLSSLNNHIRTHTGQKPFRCRYCGKRFAQSGVLTAHLRTHTGDKPFKCVICGKRFAQTTTLANHIRTHTGQKPFTCKYCKRTFAQSSTRNKHELSHTKEKPFECKYCGRSFTQSATVMRHMRIHMRDTKYSCVHCGKTFAYLYSLDKHLDAHT